MNSLVAALAVVLLSASILTAQSSQAPAPAGKPGAAAKREVSGTIKSVDPAGRTVLLADGTRLMIPASVGVNPADLKPGATVKASVEKRAAGRWSPPLRSTDGVSEGKGGETDGAPVSL